MSKEKVLIFLFAVLIIWFLFFSPDLVRSRRLRNQHQLIQRLELPDYIRVDSVRSEIYTRSAFNTHYQTHMDIFVEEGHGEIELKILLRSLNFFEPGTTSMNQIRTSIFFLISMNEEKTIISDEGSVFLSYTITFYQNR